MEEVELTVDYKKEIIENKVEEAPETTKAEGEKDEEEKDEDGDEMFANSWLNANSLTICKRPGIQSNQPISYSSIAASALVTASFIKAWSTSLCMWLLSSQIQLNSYSYFF